MKVYEAVFKEDQMTGVYGISLVDDPAMQDMWITLSEHKMELQAVNEEKRLLLGASLIPNKRIYRKIDDLEFFLTFSEETIEKLAHAYNKNLSNNNASYEHAIKLKDMSVVENWIVEDPKNDKSNTYGKIYPKGTWVTMMSVDNDDVWAKVKKGEVKGFSIEAVTGIKQINFKNQIKMSDTKEQTNGIADALKNGFSEVVNLFKTQKEAKKEETADVKEIEVKAEMTKDEAKEILKEVVSEILKELQASSETEETTEEPSESNDEAKVEMSKQVKDFENEIKDLKAELSKQTEVAPIKANPEAKKDIDIELSKLNTTKNRAYQNIAKAMNW